MRKCILFFFFAFTFLVQPDVFAQDVRKSMSVDNEQAQLTLTVTGNNVRVQNASNNAVLEVYNVLGVKVTSVKIDSSDKTVSLLIPKGCYILKIENIVRKVAIK